MCGISGLVDFDGLTKSDHLTVRKMNSVLVHRGPDGEGFFFDKYIALGHCRLSVIDLVTGGQPISNEDGSVVITFNGEIYNFRDLRVELEEKSHKFTTQSDTEVIVHLYEEMGIECLSRLEGMFAFGLWDKNRQMLFLARDRLGKKPIYYIQENRTFKFSSELKGLLQAGRISRRINDFALDQYLTFLYVPSPLTIFEGVYKIPPATALTYDVDGVKTWRYWDFDYTPKLDLSEEELVGLLLEKLKEATRARLISDVPIGAFLSGGVDSSIIVALMSRLRTEPVKTFSVGFTHDAYSELDYARIVSNLFETEHTEIVVIANAVEILPKLIWHFDEPFADPSAVPTYYMSEVAKRFVTVALNGDGGDELFAGYGKYLGTKLRKYYRYIPRWIRSGVLYQTLKLVPEGVNQKSLVNRLRRLNDLSIQPTAEANIQASVYNGLYRWRDVLYSSEYIGALTHNPMDQLRSIYSEGEGIDEIDRFIRSDLLTYLPDDLLVKVDRMSMAHGLEARSPLLDHKLVEFVARLPLKMKVSGLTRKYALRKVGERLGLPKSLLSRPKQGFEVPIADWLRGDLRSMRDELLSNSNLVSMGYLKQEAIDKLIKEHDDGRINHAERLWSLLCFELWHEQYMA